MDFLPLLLALVGHLHVVLCTVPGRRFKALYGQDMSVPLMPYTTHWGLSLTRCAMRCTDSCHGFNYRAEPAPTRCQLLDIPSGPASVTSTPGVTHYERLDNKLCVDQSVCYTYGFNLCWDDAVTMCGLIHPDAHLADIHSVQENDALAAMADGFGEAAFWAEGRRPDGAAETEFYWQHSGEQISGYTNWRTSTEPYDDPNKPENDCISVYGGWGWQWNDYSCETWATAMYMCQLD